MEHGANGAQVCRGLLSFLSTVLVYCCYCGHAWVHGCMGAGMQRVAGYLGESFFVLVGLSGRVTG
jgi:hypothetical protein